MGRGRAKAKQTKVARRLKYDTHDPDLTQLQRELGGGSAESSIAEVDETDELEDDDDPYAAYADYVAEQDEDEDEEDERPARRRA